MTLWRKYSEGVVSLGILFFVNFIIYHDYWFGRKIITGKDFLTLFYPLLNYQSDCLKEFSWPLWNPFMNFGFPYVEHYVNSALFPTHLLLGLITGSSLQLIHIELLLWNIMGGFGMYLCAREYGISLPACISAGLLFMFCGQMISLPHWSILVYNASCFPFMLLGYYRAARTGSVVSLISILAVAAMIYGGYLSSSVLGLYFFCGYVLVDSVMKKNTSFAVRYLLVTVVCAMLLAMPKILPLAISMGDYHRMSVTSNWSDPAGTITYRNFASFFLPVKFFFSLYIGQLCTLSLLYALVTNKVKLNALLIMSLLSGAYLVVDSAGNFSFIHSFAAEILPMIKLTRNEWMFWHYPLTFGILYLSVYVDAVLGAESRRKIVLAAAAVFLLLTAVFIGLYDTVVYRTAYITQAVLLFVLTAVCVTVKRPSPRAACVLLLVAIECMLLVNRVDVMKAPLSDGERMRIEVIDQNSISSSYYDDNVVRDFFYATAMLDTHRPSVNESRKWPVLYSGLGGASVINAYPAQYGNFIDSMNLKHFAGWWYNSQERFDFVAIKDSPLLVQMEGWPLFTFLSAATGMPSGNVNFDAVSCSGFDFSVNTPEAGFLILNQMHDVRWHVMIDGREARIQKAHDYFMGTAVSSGQHQISFRFKDRMFYASLAVSLATILCLCGFTLLRKRRGSVMHTAY